MSVAACADLVRQADPDRFVTGQTATPAAQAKLWPIYALNIEIARAAWASQTPLLGQMRLKWWEDGLAELAAGQAVRAHPVLAAVADVVAQTGISVAPFQAMIAARQWDLASDPFTDDAALWQHLAALYGGVMVQSAAVLGAPQPSWPVLADLGRAMGLAQWFCAVPRLLALGRAPLPNPTLAAIAQLAHQGLALHRASQRALRTMGQGGQIHPALLAGWQTKALLNRAAHAPERVINGTLALSEFRKRGSLWVKSISGAY